MLDVLRGANMELIPVSIPNGVRNASVIEAENDMAIGSYRTWTKQTGNDTGTVAPWLASTWKPTSTRWNALKTQQRRNASLLTELLNLQRLDAIVYPTTRFSPALLGDTQLSANCWISATSGLPALAIPGGFNNQHFPVVGIDLLGRALDEATLLDLAEILEFGQ
jgi:Asp-tRNA(Asn)/Glu-tRNA(Gln) amidotransferase A subunit family amidase